MNKKLLATFALAGLTISTATLPAHAIGGVEAAAVIAGGSVKAIVQSALNKGGATLAPPAQNDSTLAFSAIENTVRGHNATILSLKKTVAGVSATDIRSQFLNQRLSYLQQIDALDAQRTSYQKSARELETTIANTTDPSTKSALQNMAASMNTLAGQSAASIAMNNAILSGLNDTEDDASDDLDDSIFVAKKQAENASNQIVMQAQTQYITLCTLATNVDAINRGLAALDRSIPVLEKQYQIGMASQLDVINLKNKRDTTETTKKTLLQQIETLENSLSLMLGNDAGTTVHAQELPTVYARDLSSMNYEKDLEQAVKNSFAIWQKDDAVRQASNNYERSQVSTQHALNSAIIARDATKEQVRTSFRALFEDVSQKQRLLTAAQQDLDLAQVNFRVTETKYQKGIISKLEYQTAQDDLETIEQAVSTAKMNLFSAYNTYSWAKRGLM